MIGFPWKRRSPTSPTLAPSSLSAPPRFQVWQPRLPDRRAPAPRMREPPGSGCRPSPFPREVTLTLHGIREYWSHIRAIMKQTVFDVSHLWDTSHAGVSGVHRCGIFWNLRNLFSAVSMLIFVIRGHILYSTCCLCHQERNECMFTYRYDNLAVHSYGLALYRCT